MSDVADNTFRINKQLQNIIEKGEVEAFESFVDQEQIDIEIVLATAAKCEGDNGAVIKRFLLRYSVENLFYQAITDGNAAVVKLFCKLNVFDLTGNGSSCILLAVTCKHAEVLKILLLDGRANPAANNNEALLYAMVKNQIEIFQLLFTDQRIGFKHAFKIACRYHNNKKVKIKPLFSGWDAGHIFDEAISANDEKMVEILCDLGVTNPVANVHKALRDAARCGCVNIVKILINYKGIPANDAVNITLDEYHGDVAIVEVLLESRRFKTQVLKEHIFMDAIKKDYVEVVELLLSMFDMDPAHMDNVLVRTAAKCGRFKIVKMLLQDSRVNLSGNFRVLADFIKSIECLKYRTPQDAAEYLVILTKVRDSKLKLEKSHGVGDTYAGDSGLAEIATKVSEEKIKPMLQSRFVQDYFGSIIVVEQAIRGLILEQILKDAMSELDDVKNKAQAETILEFIAGNRESLMVAQDLELMDRARILFASNSFNSHMAWRAYDQYAPVKLDIDGKALWDNLFTSPTDEQKNKAVHSVGVLGNARPTLEFACNIVRERAAYYYLLVTDLRYTPELRQDLQQDFLAYIAEIRRTYNKTTAEVDAPCCFPGTISRLSRISNRIEELRIALPTKYIIWDVMRELVTKEFAEQVDKINYKTDVDHNDEITKLYEALILLNIRTAPDIAADPARVYSMRSDTGYTAELLACREKAVEEIVGGLDVVVTKINYKLAQQKLPVLAEADKFYVTLAMADIGGNIIAPSLTDIYERAISKFTKPKIALSVVKPVPMYALAHMLAPDDAAYDGDFVVDNVFPGRDYAGFKQHVGKFIPEAIVAERYKIQQRKRVIFALVYQRLEQNIVAGDGWNEGVLVAAKSAIERFVQEFVYVSEENSKAILEMQAEDERVMIDDLVMSLVQDDKFLNKYLSQTDCEALSVSLQPTESRTVLRAKLS